MKNKSLKHQSITGLFNEYQTYTSLGDSMHPIINNSDILIVQESHKISRGDIIVFEKEDTVVAHRIIKINIDNIITKGDNCFIQDEPIQKNQFKGRVLTAFEKITLKKTNIYKFKKTLYLFSLFQNKIFIFLLKNETIKGKQKIMENNTWMILLQIITNPMLSILKILSKI